MVLFVLSESQIACMTRIVQKDSTGIDDDRDVTSIHLVVAIATVHRGGPADDLVPALIAAPMKGINDEKTRLAVGEEIRVENDSASDDGVHDSRQDDGDVGQDQVPVEGERKDAEQVAAKADGEIERAAAHDKVLELLDAVEIRTGRGAELLELDERHDVDDDIKGSCTGPAKNSPIRGDPRDTFGPVSLLEDGRHSLTVEAGDGSAPGARDDEHAGVEERRHPATPATSPECLDAQDKDVREADLLMGSELMSAKEHRRRRRGNACTHVVDGYKDEKNVDARLAIDMIARWKEEPEGRNGRSPNTVSRNQDKRPHPCRPAGEELFPAVQLFVDGDDVFPCIVAKRCQMM